MLRDDNVNLICQFKSFRTTFICLVFHLVQKHEQLKGSVLANHPLYCISEPTGCYSIRTLIAIPIAPISFLVQPAVWALVVVFSHKSDPEWYWRCREVLFWVQGSPVINLTLCPGVHCVHTRAHGMSRTDISLSVDSLLTHPPTTLLYVLYIFLLVLMA